MQFSTLFTLALSLSLSTAYACTTSGNPCDRGAGECCSGLTCRLAGQTGDIYICAPPAKREVPPGTPETLEKRCTLVGEGCTVGAGSCCEGLTCEGSPPEFGHCQKK